MYNVHYVICRCKVYNVNIKSNSQNVYIHWIIEFSSLAMLHDRCNWLYMNASWLHKVAAPMKNRCQAHAIRILLQLLLICNVRFTPRFQTELAVRGRKRFSCFGIKSMERECHRETTCNMYWTRQIISNHDISRVSSATMCYKYLSFNKTQQCCQSHHLDLSILGASSTSSEIACSLFHHPKMIRLFERAQSSWNYDKLQMNPWIQ